MKNYGNRVSFILENAHGKTLDAGYAACSLHKDVRKKIGLKNIFGIDTEPVPKGFGGNYKRASAEKIPFRQNFFDTIIAGELMEHLKKPECFVKEANRVLKKNGKLIITTPNKNSWVNKLFHSYQTPIHFCLFSPKELKELLAKNGFQVKEFFCLPYTMESSPGASHKWFYPIRKIIHCFLPQSFQEEMIALAIKK